MSTTTQSDIRKSVDELNQMIQQGKILEAFNKFYADDIVMEEDGNERVGFEANHEYEKQFVEGVQEFRAAEVKSVAVDEENSVSFVEWHLDFTLEGVGDVEQNQVAVQRWRDGKIYNEKFYKLG